MSATSTTPGPEPADALAWESHPLRERPLAGLGTIVVIVLLGGLVTDWMGHVAWGWLAVLALCLSLHRFFFATRYRIDAQGIEARTLAGVRRVAWPEVRHARIGERGAWLSPSPLPNWRDGRRGVHVLYGRQRDKVVAELRRRLAPAEEIRSEK